MKFGRFITTVLGAALGAIVVTWWVRNRETLMLLADSQQPDDSPFDVPASDWIELK